MPATRQRLPIRSRPQARRIQARTLPCVSSVGNWARYPGRVACASTRRKANRLPSGSLRAQACPRAHRLEFPPSRAIKDHEPLEHRRDGAQELFERVSSSTREIDPRAFCVTARTRQEARTVVLNDDQRPFRLACTAAPGMRPASSAHDSLQAERDSSPALRRRPASQVVALCAATAVPSRSKAHRQQHRAGRSRPLKDLRTESENRRSLGSA